MPVSTALPVVELIRQDLLNAVGLISINDGYNIDAVAYDPKRLGTPINDGEQVVIDVLLGDEDFQDLLCNSVVEKVQEFLFVATTNQPEDAEANADALNLIVR